MSILGTALLAILAVCFCTIATVIVGTIVLVNLFAVNYEKAGVRCAIAGLVTSSALLYFAAVTSVAATVTTSLWILGVSFAMFLGWLVAVFRARKRT